MSEPEVPEEALGSAIKQHEVAGRDEDPAPYKLELAKAEGLAQFLDTLEDPSDQRP